MFWAMFGQQLNADATQQGEWAGVPVPLPDLALSLVPDHPWADRLARAEEVIHQTVPDSNCLTCTNDDLESTVINGWYSRREQRSIFIVRDRAGRVRAVRSGKLDYVRRVDLMFNTFCAYEAWLPETEATATAKLAQLIKPHLFDAYRLTGTFVETSPRSRLTYVFRRLRPTIVISWATGGGEPLCTLCLHPIGYYDNSFAGSMCPTDEVIAHLLLMRGDEHLYWKRANQHAPWQPESGL